jgi:chromosome segregation ATPase
MTVTQAGGPNLSWLDEELRREKAIVEDLRNLVDKQQVALVDQAQRILSLEDRLTRVQSTLQTLPELRQATQNARDEVVAMLGDLRQDVQKGQVEALRTRQGEREKDLRALLEIRTELGRFTALEQAATVNQAEDRRINEVVMRLQSQIEVLAKQLAQGDESRRQLQDALAKQVVALNQVAEEAHELAGVRPELLQRVLPVENDISKLAQQIGEMQGIREELTAQQAELLERQRRTERERSQTLTEWGRQLDGVVQQVESWADQMRFYADQHEKNRTVLRDVQALAHDLSQQQDRLRQLQRVAEEQLRQELREYRVENDQRWAQDLERREASRVDTVAHSDLVDGRLVDLEQAREDVAAALKAVNERVSVLQQALTAHDEHSTLVTRRTIDLLRKDLMAFVARISDTLGVEG